jgi:hypothetical protein
LKLEDQSLDGKKAYMQVVRQMRMKSTLLELLQMVLRPASLLRSQSPRRRSIFVSSGADAY